MTKRIVPDSQKSSYELVAPNIKYKIFCGHLNRTLIEVSVMYVTNKV